MAAAPGGNAQLQQMLQSAVQAVNWTYSLFWQFCPQQGVLVWWDGYYNGAIKTRKTVQAMEVSAEEASLQRSQQLRELYDTLSAGEPGPGQQPPRRPSAALSPEDLTETEWFYLMCVSFSFPPATGLPGKAYVKRQHVWLTGAHEVDSKLFSRAILAKSARVQTVVCIPLMDGVVELGSTERIQEDPSLVQHVKSFFVDHHRLPPPKPALSEHSTSNPAASSSNHHPTASRFHSPPITMYAAATTSNIHRVNEEVEDDDDDDEDNESDSEAETGRNSRPLSGAGAGQQNPPIQARLGPGASNSAAAEPSELMQVEMSEDIRLGSPEDASNNMDPDFPAAGGMNLQSTLQRRADSFSRAESSRRWPVMHHDSLLQHTPLLPLQPPPSSGATPLEEEESATEDTHYSQTVSTILQYQAGRWSSEASPPATATTMALSTQHSAFSKWPPRSDHHVHIPEEHNAQWLLKYILFTVPFLHTNKASHEDNNISSSPKSLQPGPDQSSRFRARGAPNDDLSANHVLAERRRREKLNERFIILRSLVPFVTKMDKASILGDTIEYVKQLRRKIQDLEARAGQMETERADLAEAAAKSNNSSGLTVARPGLSLDKRKVRVVEGSGGAAKAKVVESPLPPPPPADLLQVSIIESDALIEMQCAYKEGLLLDVMLVLREMHVEVTAVQSSLNSGFFKAELRAKVKETDNGKKASIVEVKRAINQIVPHSDAS